MIRTFMTSSIPQGDGDWSQTLRVSYIYMLLLLSVYLVLCSCMSHVLLWSLSRCTQSYNKESSWFPLKEFFSLTQFICQPLIPSVYKVRTQKLQGMVVRGRVYCWDEGEHSQRHLEEFRAGRESSRLSMACIWTRPWEETGGGDLQRGGEENKRWPREW